MFWGRKDRPLPPPPPSRTWLVQEMLFHNPFANAKPCWEDIASIECADGQDAIALAAIQGWRGQALRAIPCDAIVVPIEQNPPAMPPFIPQRVEGDQLAERRSRRQQDDGPLWSG